MNENELANRGGITGYIYTHTQGGGVNETQVKHIRVRSNQTPGERREQEVVKTPDMTQEGG